MWFGSSRRQAPVSNNERQRQFRKRNPGYYGRLHRKRNAAIKAALEAQWAMAAAKPVLQLPAPMEQLSLFDELQRQREREVVPIDRTATDSR